MSTLGSIFASTDPHGAPSGPDLVHPVRVPPSALGHPDGVWVEVPLQISTPEGPVERVLLDPQDGVWVPLRLPAGFPDGGRVRLRGQGGRRAGAAPGNLVLTIEVREDAPLVLSPGTRAMVTSGTRVPVVLGVAFVMAIALLALRLCG